MSIRKSDNKCGQFIENQGLQIYICFMPELPEVETVRRGLMPVMCGTVVERVTLNRPDLRVPITQGFGEVLSGVRVEDLIRRGKYIIGLGGGEHGFVLHLGMSGRVHIYRSQDVYEPGKHDHVIFDMAGGVRIVYSDPRRFGMLYLVPKAGWEDEKPFSAMGPEPLGNGFSGSILFTALKNRRVAIKNALLDQKVVAGIGNIYACEALFEAGIDPRRLSFSLSETEADRLAGAIRQVLERAIEAGGSTLKDYAQVDGSMGYFQHSFSVYDREGRSCPGCDCDSLKTHGVSRIVQSGRSTFYCSARQK